MENDNYKVIAQKDAESGKDFAQPVWVVNSSGSGEGGLTTSDIIGGENIEVVDNGDDTVTINSTGGGGDLQSAYENGNTIVLADGLPFEVYDEYDSNKLKFNKYGELSVGRKEEDGGITIGLSGIDYESGSVSFTVNDRGIVYGANGVGISLSGFKDSDYISYDLSDLTTLEDFDDISKINQQAPVTLDMLKKYLSLLQ